MRRHIGLAAVVLLVQATPAPAEECAARSSQRTEQANAPAATGNDGTGATGWTGGTGGNMAGTEHQKSSPPTDQPEEAKGLDLKMGTKPQAKC